MNCDKSLVKLKGKIIFAFLEILSNTFDQIFPGVPQCRVHGPILFLRTSNNINNYKCYLAQDNLETVGASTIKRNRRTANWVGRVSSSFVK